MNEINGTTNILGVIGNPIAHTLSPVIHNTLAELMGINAVYVPICVEDDIDAAVRGLYKSGVKGLNITVPYKQDVMKSLVEIDELAEEIGAVNTLVPDKECGGYKGYNTDMPGLKRALETKGVILKDRKVIIIGAGGAARAVCVMLRKAGADSVYILNRTVEKAELIAKSFDCDDNASGTHFKAVALDDYKKIPEDRYIMFQCTSFGLKAGDTLLIDDDSFYNMADYGYDLIYNPAITPFIGKLNELQIPNDNGLSMLLYQGIIAFEYWFDTKISDEYADVVYAKMCRKLYGDNVILVGYMGSGKTSVGKALNYECGMSFIDMDEYIVNEQGRSINDIFATDGENTFRDIETETIRKLGKVYNTVISTGGGAVLRKENRELLKKIGRVFYLKALPETVFQRVKDDTTRPLLKSESEEELMNRIVTMLDKRSAYYETAADVIIDTDGCGVNEIAAVIRENAGFVEK